MYKFKRLSALILVLALMLTIGGTVTASDYSAFNAIYEQAGIEEMRRIDEVKNAPIGTAPTNICAENADFGSENTVISVSTGDVSPLFHGNCTNCGSFTEYVCKRQAIWYDTGTHGDCTVNYLKSGGQRVCRYCLAEYEDLGEHDCWQVHLTCAKGEYDVCPMDVT